jgi:asparagine N-glycosylation enzyme membrane subunit Stt3
MSRVVGIATPVLLFMTAIAVRLLSWHSVFQRDGVYPNGNDAYYHFRRIGYSIEHFPNVLEFDPLINFPHGAQPIWPSTFDWLMAAMLRGIPGIDQPGQLERFAVWAPPLLGAATVVFVYFIGLRFFSRTVAIIAGASMAILPAHAIYSRLGSVDHHVLVASVVAVMLSLAMTLFREGSPAMLPSPRIGLSAGLGLSMAAAVLVWPGSLLQVGLLQLAMVVRLVTATEEGAAKVWALRFSIVQLAACVAVYPMSAGNEWQQWGALSPVVLSDFQPLYFFAAFACFALSGWMWQLGWGAEKQSTRMIGSGLLGLVLLVGLLLAIPDLGLAITDALSWFAKDEEFQSAVNESVPLFGGRAGSARAVAFLGGFVYAVPFSVVYLTWQFRQRAEVLLLIGWGSGLFLATLVQWRFMNSYSIAHCLLIGITIESVHEALRPRLTSRLRNSAAVALGLVVVLLAIVSPIKSYSLHLDNIGRNLRGEATVPVGKQLHVHFVADAARYLRDHSPPPQSARYSVLGPWGDGHILKYVGERAVVQDNFGDDTAPENFQLAEEYFATTSEAEALDFVSPLGTRYVLVRSTGSGHSHGYAPDSLFSRLYLHKGSGRRPRTRGGQFIPAIQPLRRHRLIYQSAPLEAGDPEPYCMLFEVVAGAELVGRASPGAVVRVSLTIEPRLGHRFVYSAETLADPAGEYSFRLPYSNEQSSPDVRTGDRYRLRAGDDSVALIVPESAVLDGARIEAPPLGR